MDNNEHIGFHINVASHQIRRKIDSFSVPLGMSDIQLRILGFLQRAEGENRDVFQRDIEKKFGIRRSSVTSVISNLEQNHYIERQCVCTDARLKKLVLTDSGREKNFQMRHRIDEMENFINQCFSEEERAQFLHMLKILIEKLENEN